VIDLSRNGYTNEQIIEQLHGPTQVIDFRYELLDLQNRRKFDLTNVEGGKIDYNSFAQIKRSASFSMIENETLDIDYMSDRIKPYMRLQMRDAGWVEFPLGVFLLSSPSRKDDGFNVVREIDAYDGLVVLIDDKVSDRYTIAEGTGYYTAIVDALTSAGINLYNIEQTDKTLPRALEFEPGTEKLTIINELLSQLNYTPLHVDVEGYYTTHTYRSPTERSEDYAYLTDGKSVIFEDAEEELDLFNVPNVFKVVRTNEEETPLISTLTNDNPSSPTSTVTRGRSILDYREINDIADQESLNAYVIRIAFEASQVFGVIRFTTALMPFHGFSNVLRFQYDRLGIDGKFLEMIWSMDLSHEGTMSHEIRQIVNIGVM
jgi:hypothetical protein